MNENETVKVRVPQAFIAELAKRRRPSRLAVLVRSLRRRPITFKWREEA